MEKTDERKDTKGKEKFPWPEGRESRQMTGREEGTRGGREGS